MYHRFEGLYTPNSSILLSIVQRQDSGSDGSQDEFQGSRDLQDPEDGSG